MANQWPKTASIFDINLRPVTSALFLGLILTTAVIAAPAAQAQTFQVLHAFTGGQDGAAQEDGLTIDQAGNLYGTASAGGNQVSGYENNDGNTGCGSVFKLAHDGSGWVLTPLYDFEGGSGGNNPGVGVVFGPDGALYGAATTTATCDGFECGLVYSIRPRPNPCGSFLCSWQETVLHQFTGAPDGLDPDSRVIFDAAGNLYGSTVFGGPYGGAYGYGTVYELTPSHGSWTENVIYSFNPNLPVAVVLPSGGLFFDQAGSLYGTAELGWTENVFGGVWQLQPSQSGWNYNLLYYFNGYDGAEPLGLIGDGSGNLYGVTAGAVGNDSGTIYELSPSGSGWNYNLVYDFGFEDYASGLVMDSAGNFYGVNSGGFFNDGNIFKLTKSGSTWTYSVLHTFSGADGAGPEGSVVIDSSGNLYGTAAAGGH